MDVGDILKEAYDGVAAELDGVIKDVTITRSGVVSYDTTTGQNVTSAPVVQTGRAVIENEQVIRNVFPGYVITGTERLVLLQGLSWAPAEGDTAAVGGLTTRRVAAVLDLLGSGQGFRAILV